MQHLDEGTIHAWLDGALSTDEAARVERHAGECAECAALVAEARGLVAGASRVLSALDDVPVVLPGAMGGGRGVGVEPIEARRARGRRFWSRSAALAAAASVVLMAGTAYVWNETGGPGSRMVESGAEIVARPSEVPASPDSGAMPTAGEFSASARSGQPIADAAGKEAAPVPRQRAVDGARRDTTRRRIEATAPAAAPASPADELTRKAAAQRPAAQLSETLESALTDTVTARQRDAARRAAANRTAAARARSERAVPTTGAEVPVQGVRRVDTVYQIRNDTVYRVRIDTVTIVVDPPEPPSLRGASTVVGATRGVFSLVGCYEVLAGGLPKFVTLDTTRVASGTGAPRFAARAPGVSGYWSPDGTSGIQLVIASSAVDARLDPSTGELRGTARRGAMTSSFAARRGCR